MDFAHLKYVYTHVLSGFFSVDFQDKKRGEKMSFDVELVCKQLIWCSFLHSKWIMSKMSTPKDKLTRNCVTVTKWTNQNSLYDIIFFSSPSSVMTIL